MKIAPIDIAHKTFTRKMMGLDQDEVMDFLRQIADEMEGLVRERNSLRETLREKELAILEYRERDELLKNTITTATKMSDRIQQDADREARLIISDAKQQAEMIVRDARDSLKRIFQEITDLKKIRLQFENSIRAIVHSHLTMLDQGHKVMPDPQIENRPGFIETAQQPTAGGAGTGAGVSGGATHGAGSHGSAGMHGAQANPSGLRKEDQIRSNVADAVKDLI